MLKKTSLVFGIVLLLIGLAGFVPGLSSTDTSGAQQLLSMFMTDTVHSLLFVITGLLGLWGAMNNRYAKWYLLGVGGLYGLITLIGFFDTSTFGLLAVNMNDNYLHLVLTIGLLGGGLWLKGNAPVEPAAVKKAM